MPVGSIILLVLAAVFVVILSFMVIRTILTKPKKTDKTEGDIQYPDETELKKHLIDAVRIPTVTPTAENPNTEPFKLFHEFLARAYPHLHAAAEKTEVNGLSLIYSIKGSDESLLPAAFLAHQDVVPANASEWECDPFGGEEKDGYIYARGAQDMKGHMVALLDAIETLLQENCELKRGIYLCFGHDEECTGVNGAKKIVEFLKAKNIRFEFVLDEGGTVMDGGIIGVQGMLALIGTCEKGYMDVLMTAKKTGGHASTPASRTAVGTISEAVYDLEMSPMKATWSQPAKEMFQEICPYMNPIFKFLFVNRDILAPLLKLILTKASPVTNALFRTTFAATQLKGSDAPNVLSPLATANINCRVNIGETTEDVIKHIKSVVGGKIDLTTQGFVSEPSPVSPIGNASYKTLKKTIEEVFQGFHAAPFPFIAGTDSKYYYALTENVYRFGPFPLSEDDRSRLHAKNERTKVEDLVKASAFFRRLIENSCK